MVIGNKLAHNQDHEIIKDQIWGRHNGNGMVEFTGKNYPLCPSHILLNGWCCSLMNKNGNANDYTWVEVDAAMELSWVKL
jgi:hypothetical protein